jgi:protein-serine/threonine kinase
MSEPAILGSISASKSSSFDTTSPDQDEAISPPADTDLTQSTWNPRIDNHGASPDTQPRQDQNLREVNAAAFHNNAFLRPVDTAVLQAFPAISTQRASPLSAELRVQTDLWMKPEIPVGVTPRNTVQAELLDKQLRKVPSSSKLPVRSHSIKSALAGAFYTGGSLSPASAASSPGVGPLSEITPLPSPIVPGGSPGPWKAMNELSNTSSTSPVEPDSTKSDTFLSPISYTKGSPKKRSYQGITSAAAGTIERDLILKANAANHDRNRTLSEYAPSPTPPRTRYNAVSGSQQPHTPAEPLSPKPMHREEYLAVQRGIATIQTPRPPTPPPSNRSATGSSDVESPPSSPIPIRGGVPLRYEATDIRTGELRRWSAIRQLGKGTFSTVMLATSEDKFDADENTKAEDQFDPKSLVAVKICEHGPAGGADEQKIQSSLKRELDILKAIDHPSLVHLQAVNVEEKRAFLVLNYAAGGDLFELASLQLDLLTPSLIRRIFAELVQAVRYLHSQYIVHRDIKLESMLITTRSDLSNLPY